MKVGEFGLVVEFHFEEFVINGATEHEYKKIPSGNKSFPSKSNL